MTTTLQHPHKTQRTHISCEPDISFYRFISLFIYSGQKYATRRGRRQSHEFEDLHVNTTTGKLTLPKLQMLGARSSRSGTPSPYSLSPSPSRRNVDGNWVGDPEAIRSVRRPRKSVEEQGKDRAMLRSQVA